MALGPANYDWMGFKIPFQQYSREGNAAQTAVESFNRIYGRNPTNDELNQVLPSFLGGDKNIPDSASGNALISQMHTAEQNSPTALANKQQQQAMDAYNKDPNKFNSQVNQVFQQGVGRDASSDEAQHFGALLASGQIDQYGMQQLLGQSQEAQQRQTSQYQDELSKNLQSTQGDYFKNYIEPSILSQTASAGRDPNSSGVQNAEVQAGKQQNYDLQNYLANFGASQYGQSAQNQQNVYQQYLGQQYNMQNANINQGLGQQSYIQNLNTNLQNYNLQQQAYQNYQNQYGKRNNGLGSLLGGVAGGALGAWAGGPAGAAAGYQLGSGLGGAIQGGGNQSSMPNINYSGLGSSWGGSGGGSSGYGATGSPQLSSLNNGSNGLSRYQL